jgi:O-acetyl-ADP-ribose deacetylase (regulator of RNase III)
VELPAISTGIFGFPKERGARIILDAIEQFLQEYPGTSLAEIQIVLIDQPSVDIFAKEFHRRWPGLSE